MTRVEMVKLLLNTPQIKQLFESGRFTTAEINKMIVEEVLREEEVAEEEQEERERKDKELAARDRELTSIDSFAEYSFDELKSALLGAKNQDQLDNAKSAIAAAIKNNELGDREERTLTKVVLPKVEKRIQDSPEEEPKKISLSNRTPNEMQQLEKIVSKLDSGTNAEKTTILKTVANMYFNHLEDDRQKYQQANDLLDQVKEISMKKAQDLLDTLKSAEGLEDLEAAKEEAVEYFNSVGRPNYIDAANSSYEKRKAELEASSPADEPEATAEPEAADTPEPEETPTPAKPEIGPDFKRAFSKLKRDLEKEEEGKPPMAPTEIARQLADFANERLKTYSAAESWGDLSDLHKIDRLGDSSFGKWKEENVDSIRDFFSQKISDLERIMAADPDSEDLGPAMDDIVGEMDDLSDEIIDDIAAIDDVGDDVSGADVDTNAAEEAELEKFVADNELEIPTLMADDQFKSNLMKVLLPLISQEADIDMADSDDVADNADGDIASSDIDSDSNLTEEEVPEEAGETDPEGSPVDVEDAVKLKSEIEALQNIFDSKKFDINVEDFLSDSLRATLEDALPTSPEMTDEEASEQGSESANADADRESATFKEKYEAHLPEMDNFFSAPNATKLGFMEQFLLKDQSRLLWTLISALSDVAEKSEARAINTAQEEEEEGIPTEETPVDPEVSGISEEVYNEVLMALNEEDEESEVELSDEDRVSIKKSLSSLLRSITKLRAMVRSYEENMTRVSVDPALDGSSLKQAIDDYLPFVQRSIAKIVERANEAFERAVESIEEPAEEEEVETAEVEPETEETEETEEADDVFIEILSLLSEDDQSVEVLVTGIYNQMRQLYAPAADPEASEGLQGMLADGSRAKAIATADEMLELASQEDFISLFPSGMLGKNGIPVTVKQAVESLTALIKKFADMMRDVLMLAKDDVIPASTLGTIISNLTEISKTIENFFGEPSRISGDTLEQIQQRAGEDESERSLTDEDTLEATAEFEDDDEDGSMSDFVEEADPEVSDLVDTFFEGEGVDDEERKALATLWQNVANEVATWYSFALEDYFRNMVTGETEDTMSENLFQGTNVEKIIRKIKMPEINSADQKALQDELETLFMSLGSDLSDELEKYPKIAGISYDMDDIADAFAAKFEGSPMEIPFNDNRDYNETIGKILRAMRKNSYGSMENFLQELAGYVDKLVLEKIKNSSDESVSNLFKADKPESPEDEEGEVLDTPEDGETGEAPEDKTGEEGGATSYDKALRVANDFMENPPENFRNRLNNQSFELNTFGGDIATMTIGFYIYELMEKGFSSIEGSREILETFLGELRENVIKNTEKWVDSQEPESETEAKTFNNFKRAMEENRSKTIEAITKLVIKMWIYIKTEFERLDAKAAEEAEIASAPAFNEDLKVANEFENTLTAGQLAEFKNKFADITGGLSFPFDEKIVPMFLGFYFNELVKNRISDASDILAPDMEAAADKVVENMTRWASTYDPEDDRGLSNLEFQLEKPKRVARELLDVFRDPSVVDYLNRELDEFNDKDLEESLKPIINRMLQEHYNT